jgi:large subunit ribosomal protein L17
MRHRVSGKQLSRTTSHRRALRRNLAASLIQHGAIRTTEAKAKELRRFVERLITVAREGTLHARRQAAAMLQDRDMIDDEGKLLDKTVLQKLCDEVAPRYVSRDGGYTRIVRLSDRRIGDGGVQVLVQLVEQPSRQTGGKGEEKK